MKKKLFQLFSNIVCILIYALMLNLILYQNTFMPNRSLILISLITLNPIIYVIYLVINNNYNKESVGFLSNYFLKYLFIIITFVFTACILSLDIYYEHISFFYILFFQAAMLLLPILYLNLKNKLFKDLLVSVIYFFLLYINTFLFIMLQNSGSV